MRRTRSAAPDDTNPVSVTLDAQSPLTTPHSLPAGAAGPGAVPLSPDSATSPSAAGGRGPERVRCRPTGANLTLLQTVFGAWSCLLRVGRTGCASKPLLLAPTAPLAHCKHLSHLPHDTTSAVRSYAPGTVQRPVQGPKGVLGALLRTMPLWLTVVLLLLTRIEPLGLRERIRSTTPAFTVDLGTFLRFRLSAWLVVQVSDIFGQAAETLDWKYELLYVPFLLPFLAVSAATVAVFRKDLPPHASPLSPFRAAFKRCAPASAPILRASLCHYAVCLCTCVCTASPRTALRLRRLLFDIGPPLPGAWPRLQKLTLRICTYNPHGDDHHAPHPSVKLVMIASLPHAGRPQSCPRSWARSSSWP